MSTVTTTPAWSEITVAVPALAELSYLVAGTPVPTRMPAYGKAYLELVDLVANLCEPLGDEAFQVARDRLHRVFTDNAMREAAWS